MMFLAAITDEFSPKLAQARGVATKDVHAAALKAWLEQRG